ncbi:hypothetical protein AB4Y30_06100 [Ornithinibacillus sp. 4-3]|uniref:Uncharacterized protein n=1 Tax=Ornithinibacillus sp. 4-3 TaxID=3231488 RepID=A0AB39HTH8_9BACI
MFLEVLSDLFANSPVFYMYFGMFIFTVGWSQMLIFQHHRLHVHMNVTINELQKVEVDNRMFTQPLIQHVLFINWFIKKFKRADKSSTDQEDTSLSYFKNRFKIRGGQKWRKTTYLHPLQEKALY